MLRGLVMVVMSLDHTRDFFSNAHFDPTDLSKTWPALFFTRWITHFCAPVFVFLAGTSAYLWAARRHSASELGRFLLERGTLLLILVATVEALAWDMRADLRQLDAGVLWAIGWSMIVLAGLTRLPLPWLVGFGGAMVVSHNLFDSIKPAELGGFGAWWAILHTGDDIDFGGGWKLNPYYPLIPWIGVMALGYGFGRCINANHWRTPRNLWLLGGAVFAAFVLLRFTNTYGDPSPWQVYPDPIVTTLSFLNCHKYPPSLLYLLMTLGPALMVLGILEAIPSGRCGVLQLFGRTPLFFYLLHLYVIHLLALLVAWLTDGPVSVLVGGGIWLKDLPADYGYGLPIVYALWLLVLVLMYPCCRSFEALKNRKPHWRWLKYL